MINVTATGIIAAVQVLATIFGAVGGVVFAHKKGWIKSAEQNVIAAAPVIAEVVTEGETILRNVLHAPQLAGVDLKIHQLASKLADSQIVQIAGTALHSFSKHISQLTEDERATAVLFVQTEAKKRFGLTINASQILAALSDAQKLADEFVASDLFTKTRDIVAVKASVVAAQATDQQATA